MDINNPAAILRLRERWQTRFLKAFTEGPKPLAEMLCQMEDSTDEIEVYDLLVKFPAFKKFAGNLTKDNMAFAQHRVRNEEWHDVVEVPRANIERDKIGRYNNMFDMLGQAARRHPDALLAETLAASFATTDYTGTNFYAANKPHIPGVVDAQTFTNLMTEKPSAASFEKASQLLAYIKDATGQPMNVGGKKMVVCSDKWGSTFRKILKAETIAEVVTGEGAVSVANIYAGAADLAVFSYLNTAANQDKWFVLDMSWPLRSFIYQSEVKPRFIAQDNDKDEPCFTRHVNVYQGYYRGNIGLGLPQLSIGSTGADAAL